MPDLKAHFAVARLALFGSVSRGEAHPDSDVDILVEFAGPATLDGFMGLKAALENLLDARVDLATARSLRPALRAMVEKDLLDVA
ncbi:nucleotidyltransferase family protein [Geothrix sp. PMB-07]|uniref:nucleotidyltransferase family protein n=1 Tax=Geothrix sp. PMB-07 TaxID=3068640 RepID=UPI002740F929|nr:nucleotidyltransferase family protein [Geothrix sp. PMB-07]WLT31270.1 nucleotidyltransferase family protein [Geothrix sp. PMB-07]